MSFLTILSKVFVYFYELMVSNSISIDREKDSELLQVQEFLETLKNNPDQVINSVIKKEYLELLNIAFENAKTNRNWAISVLPVFLSLGIVENREVKKEYLELLNIAFENAKTDRDWARSVLPALLSLGIVEKGEIKKEYLELLSIAFENAKTDSDWARSVLPVLLKLGIVEKEELQKALLTKEQAYHLFEILFLQKYSQKLSAQDLIQF